jgi:hypothetical protein
MIALLVVFASQVHFTPAPLKQLAGRSEWVLIAERDREPDRWKVIETLHWKGSDKPPAGPITVLGAGQEMREMMAEHYAKHGSQGMPSPTEPSYPSSIAAEKFPKTRRAILFLRRWKKDWQLTMEGGYEAVIKKTAVLEALKP